MLGVVSSRVTLFSLSKEKRLRESSGPILYVNKVGYGPNSLATVASDELNSLFY